MWSERRREKLRTNLVECPRPPSSVPKRYRVRRNQLAVAHLASTDNWLVDANFFSAASQRLNYERANIGFANAGARAGYEQPARHLDSQKLFRRCAHRDRVARSARPGAERQRRLVYVQRQPIDDSATALGR